MRRSLGETDIKLQPGLRGHGRAESGSGESRIGNQTGGRVLFFFHTDNFDLDYERFRTMGIEFTEGPSDHSYGKVAVFKDLYGNRIDLIGPIHESRN